MSRCAGRADSEPYLSRARSLETVRILGRNVCIEIWISCSV